MQKLAQRKFIKGVVASAQDFEQPQGSVPRASNFSLIRRGAFRTIDGTKLISVMVSGGVTGPQPGSAFIGIMMELFLYEPNGLAQAYFALIKNNFHKLGFPTGLAAADGGAAGNLSAGSYSWIVTALDGAGGETTASVVSNVLVLAANHKANLTWVTVPLATGYNVYRTLVNQQLTGPWLLVNGATPVTTNSYTDNIADVNLGIQQPSFSVNTTQTTSFFKLKSPSYNVVTDIIFTFPADLPPLKDGTDGGYGGGGTGGGIGGGTGGQNPPTPAGGVAGNLSPIPQIVQFNNLMIMALGNGISPYSSDGTTPNTIPLTNTFTATYPARANTSATAKGDLITVTVGGTAYVYKAIQGGTTAAGAPVFPAGINVTVADGSVIWQNIGVVGTNPAPRGAAHCIVYAGSLWVFNTSITNTADNFDGPSCLKMSDTNNQNSWNPLNVAFLDKDDGSQGMGLAVYTIAEAGIAPTGSLVAFKEFSTFQIIGIFGAADFAIQRAQTDMGCVAPRSIQFVPGFGIVRLTHLGIAVFDGVRDRLISEEVRPYIFGGLSDVTPVDWNFVYFSKATQTANPPMYCCALPLQISAAPLPLAITSITAGAGPSVIPNGTYYAVVYLQDTQSNYFKSAEFGPIVLNGANPLFNIQSPSVPSNVFRYWLFYGPTPGGENTLISIDPNFVSTNMAIGYTAGIPSGVPFTSSGMLFRVLCYDLVLKSWVVVDLPFAISVFKQFRSLGTIPITVMGGFSDGATRRWQAGDPQWDAGATNAGAPDLKIHYSLRSAEVFGRNSTDRIFFRRISLRGKGDPTGLTATFTTNGLDGPSTSTQNFTVQMFGNSEFVAYVDLAVTCLNAYVKISGAAAAAFEVDSLDWSYMPKPVGGLVAV